MLTVILLLSGPHRLAMMETAFASIPIDSPAISEVLVRHQGGRWDWGGEVRERILSHDKVRLVEFPDKLPFKESLNRTFDAVNTQWALLLPDDDFLVRPAAKQSFEYISQRSDLADCGLVVFGWYYLKDGRYVSNRFVRPQLASVLTATPKFCATMFNMRRVREAGGFADMGGFVDLDLYGRLICEFDAAVLPVPVGVYRLHAGQESNRIKTLYEPYFEAVRASLGRYARTTWERVMFERALREFVWPTHVPGYTRLKELAFQLRSRSQPQAVARKEKLYRWSEG